MAIFATNIQQNSTVGSIASVIFDTDNTSTTMYGPLGSITAGDVLTNLAIVNTGANTVYVGYGSTSAGVASGMPIVAGGQMNLVGYNVTSTANSSTGDVWAQTTGTGLTSSVTVGLFTEPQAV